MLKNIQEIINLPSLPQMTDDIEEYARSLDQYNNDMQRSLEDYSRMLSDNIIEQPRWDDLRFPATRIRQGATSKPDFDTTNLGLLFPQNDTGEIAYIICQMPHEYKLGTNLRPHIHYLQDETTLPVFKIDYKVYNNGDTIPASWTTSTCNTSAAFTYSSGSIMQIIGFPEIDMSSIDEVSGIIDIKLYRDDNVVTGDVLLKEFDIHYQIDSLGSREEYRK